MLAAWGQPRSTFCARQRRTRQPVVPRRRGPKTKYTDAGLLDNIRALLAGSPFHGEGHRKIRARLRVQDICTYKRRVLRIMGESQLQMPRRQLAPVAEKPHAGSIVTSELNQMWGTDTTAAVTLAEGHVTVFAAVDHCTAECVAIHDAICRRAAAYWDVDHCTAESVAIHAVQFATRFEAWIFCAKGCAGTLADSGPKPPACASATIMARST